MKVAFLGDRLGLATGGNLYVARVAEELAKLGVEVTLITLVPPQDVPWSPELKIISEKVDLTFGQGPRPGSLARFFQAKIGAVTRLRALIREQYDILYSVGGPSNIVQALCRFGPFKPRVSVAAVFHLFRQTSSLRFFLNPETYRKPFQTFYHLSGDALAKRFLVVTVSETWRKKLISRGFSSDRIRVISVGADKEGWPVLPSDKAKEQLGLSGRLVIYTNPFRIKKGVLRLLEAVVRLREHYPGLLLLVSGRSDAETPKRVDRFLKRNQLENHFRYAGLVPRDQLPLYYSAADIVALISQEEEGWGLTLLEGLLSGKPVICSPLGAMPELVGEVGLVLKENSLPDLIRTLKPLLDSTEERERRGEEGPSQAARFSYQSAARAHLRLFEEALSKAGVTLY